MATVARSAIPLDAERRFYGRMAIAIAVTAFIGFAPSFYLLQSFSYPRPNPTLTPLIVLHGLALTGWLALFYTQTRLIAARRHDIHRQLGVWGFALACLIVPVSYFVAMAAVPRRSAPPFIDPASFSAVPLLALPPMAFLLAMGWRSRREPQAHKRFMLLFTLCMVEPALSRWPIFPPVLAGHVAANLLAFAFVIPLLLWDRRTMGGLHRATKIGLCALAFGYFARYPVWALGFWPDVVRVLPG